MLRILFLPTNVIGVNYWRMGNFANSFNHQKNVECAMYNRGFTQSTVGNWEREFTKNVKVRDEIYKLFKMCDIAVVQYSFGMMTHSLIEMWQEHFKKPTLVEIDDYVTETPGYNPAFLCGFKPGSGLEQLVIDHLKLANKGIVCSTDYLKTQYLRFNRNTFTVPNCIDFKFWNVKNNNKTNKRVRVGWIGGSNHNEDLEILSTVIPQVIERDKTVEFVFVHGFSPEIKKLNEQYKRNVKCIKDWAVITKYPQFISKFGFDIGLAPLIDNSFNRGKSNLRWLEYSALRIPTVATNIEPYTKSIKSGKTGFLVKRQSEWVDSILELVNSVKLRKEMGNNAYTEITNNYNIETVSQTYLKKLRSLV